MWRCTWWRFTGSVTLLSRSLAISFKPAAAALCLKLKCCCIPVINLTLTLNGLNVSDHCCGKLHILGSNVLSNGTFATHLTGLCFNIANCQNDTDGEQSSTYWYREFPVSRIFHIFGGIGTGIKKNWYRKKVSEPVSEKFGTGKKSRNRYQKNLVPEKSLRTSIEKIWYRKF